MDLYFATEARFLKREGVYYSLGGFSKELWYRYLEHFDKLIVIARVSSDKYVPLDNLMIASCDGVDFIELPYYVGLVGFIKSRNQIRQILNSALHPNGAYICRLPGQIGGEVIKVLNNKAIPYSCEVAGNPWDVFAKGSINHPLRPIIRILSTYKLKKQIKGGQACLYVTKHTLQSMYPTKDGAFSVGVSDVIIKKEVISQTPKILNLKQIYTVISVGSLAQMYKAPDIVLQALYILKQKNINVKLVWLGDGIFQTDMENLARKLDIKAEFKGNVSSTLVHQNLNNADIFLLVSRTEGLPRAIVEAMAHGLPCIGTRVGGIPELLDDCVIVQKDNPKQLAELIEKMLLNPSFANEQAKRNLSESYLYEETKLKILRDKFFNYLKEYGISC